MIAALLACRPPAAPEPTRAVTEHWAGTVDVGPMELAFTAHLLQVGDAWDGTIDIPMQNAADLPLFGVQSDGEAVRFTIAVGDDAVFDTRRDGDTATGTMTQRGQSFPVSMRLGDDEGPRRPQTPKPPFPYRVEEVTYRSDVPIAGTLTIPEGEGPFTGVLLITGSGPQDRDETLFLHKPFAVIADRLTRDGVAVLRVDDRGVGGTGGVLSQATVDDLVSDVLAGVEFLGARPEVDRVGVIGHSEGGIIGPMAAVRSERVAFVVMLAGTGLPGSEILVLQGRAMYERHGVAGDDLDALLERHRAAVTEPSRDTVRALIDAQRPGEPATDAEIASAMSDMSTPWFRSFVALDPRDALREVKVPVLALFGELDFQVPPVENAPAVREALPAATVEVFPGLNHLFQPAKTGMLDEYGQIETTIAPEVLDRVSTWVVGQGSRLPD